jgi:hypothetical protein
MAIATDGGFRERKAFASVDGVLRLLLADSPSKSSLLASILRLPHFVFGRFLGRDRQTVINLVQSSQIKIACRSSYVQGAILTVDESQHCIAFLVPTIEVPPLDVPSK